MMQLHYWQGNSSPGWAPLPCYLHLCASVTKQYNLVVVLANGGDLFGWESIQDVVEIKGSLPLGL